MDKQTPLDYSCTIYLESINIDDAILDNIHGKDILGLGFGVFRAF